MQLSGIAHQIWDEKYRYKNNDGEPIDQTVGDTFERVARALAVPEGPLGSGPAEKWSREFYEAMSNFSIIPAGRVLAGAGTGREVTLMNCFVMGKVPDSLSGIHDMLKCAALTMQQGGGIGTDFSTLRPNGALISKLGVGASGPLTFMDEWDAMCRSIMSAGHRRGAMMGTLRIDHPDIEAFIEAKRDKNRWRMFNVSVLVTDEFMEAVKSGHAWQLVFGGKVYKTVDARQLWDKIMRSTYDYADPGVIFIDRVNATNPLRYEEELISTNPCAEKPMPEWGACCLGSLNLARMVDDPFTRQASINWSRISQAARTLTRMLDNVIDVSNYPLPQQREEMMRKRRIGIGITGFADMLAMLGIMYSDSTSIANTVSAAVAEAAAEASVKLGEEKGSFPLYDPEQYKPQFCVGAKHRRNSHLTSIAPTGTISLFAGNISSGIEPIFDLTLKRRILQKDNSWQEVDIQDYAYAMWKEMYGPHVRKPEDMEHIWQTVADLQPEHHLNILAACQRNVDSAISKTVNCPEDITYEAFKDVYLQAYKSGAKSCATYRPNEITGSILSSTAQTTSEASMSNVVELSKPLQRPAHLHGSTYRLKPPSLEHALFITINDTEQNGVRRPYEIFINTKNLEFQAWSTALTLMISAIFRRGGDIAFITDELSSVVDPHRGGYWEDKQFVPSVIAGIGKVVNQHLQALGVAQQPVQAAKHCPKCNGKLHNKEGCWCCTACDYSACG